MGSKLSRFISHGRYGDGGNSVRDNFNTGGSGGASEGVKHATINDDYDGIIEDDDFNDFSRDFEDDNSDDGGKAKRKTGDSNILDAIEDMQKMSRDELTAEFERVSRQTNDAGSPMNNPCYDSAHKLMECVRRNPEHLMKCFSIMDAYRSCISHSYREQIEFFLDKDIDALFPPVEPDLPKKRSEKETGETEQPKKKFKKPIHPPPMVESNITKKATEVTTDPSKKNQQPKVVNEKKVPWYQWPPWK